MDMPRRSHEVTPSSPVSPLKMKYSRPNAPSTIRPEATYTPLCRPLSSCAKVAFSFALTVNTPMIEHRMPRPASAMGAAASLRASVLDWSPVSPPTVNAAAAPRAIVARIEP